MVIYYIVTSSSKKWQHSGCTLKVEAREFSSGLDVEYKGEVRSIRSQEEHQGL